LRKPISRRQRFDALEKCSYKCVYCGRGPADGVVLHVDHAEPVACGGRDEEENLVASCEDCNLGKMDRIVALPEFPPHTFLGWLRVQKAREDIVGDLARDEARARLIEPTSFKHLARQILAIGPGANMWKPDGSPLCAAWHAWREYRRGGKPTILVERLRARNAEVRAAWAKETEERLLKEGYSAEQARELGQWAATMVT